MPAYRLALPLALLLAACAPVPEAAHVPPAGGPVPQMPPLDPGLGPVRLAEQGCLRAVAVAAGTPQVAIVNGDFSPDGTVYQITTGPQVWRCTGFGDGTTADVAPMA